MRSLLWATAGVMSLAIGQAQAEPGGAASATPLDQLIKSFNAGAPVQDGVAVEGWVEDGPSGAELVVVIEPRGGIKLIADPGITVTPSPRPGIEWLTELPYRKTDPDTEYFTPPATVRLPFTANDHQPVELLVEYAYCVVDFQCFFGEQTLTVATAR